MVVEARNLGCKKLGPFLREQIYFQLAYDHKTPYPRNNSRARP